MDIKEFVEKNYGEYKIKNNNINVKICPFCKGKSGKDGKVKPDNLYTFGINLENGQYNCLRGSCGARGHINMLSNKKIKKNIMKTSSNTSFDKNKFMQEMPKTILLAESEQAVKWANSRGISIDTLKHYNCRAEEKTNFLVIPIYQEGVLVNFKKRNTNGLKIKNGARKSIHSANGKSFLIGTQLCNFKNNELIIVEGEMEVLTLHEAGFENVVSVPTGANDSWINECLWFLDKFETVTLWLDNDESGIKATKKICDRLHKKVFIVQGRKKDPNEYFLNYKKEDAIRYLKEDYENKREPEIEGVIELTSFDRLDITQIKTFRTGFSGLDKYLKGWRLGELTVWTGKRQSGKSTMIGQSILQLVEENTRVFVYTGELSKNHFREWLFLQANGESELKGVHNKISYDYDFIVKDDVFKKISYWIKDKVFLYDSEDIASENELIKVIKKTKISKDCSFFIIDNLTTVKLEGQSDNFYRKQSEFIANLKAVCRNFDTHIHLIVHPKKVDDADKNVKVSDIGGSGDISNLADNVVIVQRMEDDKSDCKVSIGKNRMFGINKSFALDFDRKNKRFYSPESKTEKYRKYNWEKVDDSSIEDLLGDAVADDLPDLFKEF